MSTTRSAASPAPPAAGRAPSPADGGTAIIGTVFGFLVFFVLLLFCVEALFHLYVASMVTAAATDAADTVAQSGGSPAAEPAAQATAVADLGGWGARHATFQWVEADGQLVRLRVVAETGALLPLPGLSRRIERTVTVRTEVFRGAP